MKISIVVAVVAISLLLMHTPKALAAQDSSMSGRLSNMVVAPGGDPVYYIIATGKSDQQSQSIVECHNACAQKIVLLSSSSGKSPESNLTGLNTLMLSPDATKLYFQAQAWATSNAIHVVDIKTKQTRFITGGELACIVGSGQYQGDLIIQQHKYFIQGGSYDPLFLFSPTGKKLGIVALDSSESPRFCGGL